LLHALLPLQQLAERGNRLIDGIVLHRVSEGVHDHIHVVAGIEDPEFFEEARGLRVWEMAEEPANEFLAVVLPEVE
jgi:hypothetical protein